MKKNKTNLLIPLFVLVGLIVVLGVILWNEDFLEIFKPDRNVLQRVEGYPKVINSNKDNARDRVEILSEQDFQNFISNNFENPSEVSLPKIDFSSQRLIIAVTENNETTGYGVKIRSVKNNPDDKRYEVYSTYTKPGESCIDLENVRNTAIDMVIIPRNDLSVAYNRETKVIECN